MTNPQATPKLSYDHGVSDKKLIGETIGMFFDRQVEKYRAREALVVRHQNVRWSWGELALRVDELAAGLMTLGLERGDRVGIWSPNTSEWTLAQFATAKAGAILVNGKWRQVGSVSPAGNLLVIGATLQREARGPTFHPHFAFVRRGCRSMQQPAHWRGRSPVDPHCSM